MAKKMPEGRPFTTETAKECGHNGGKASGEAKRKKKLLKDCLNELLASEITDKNGVTRTGSEAAAVTLWRKFMKTGDPHCGEKLDTRFLTSKRRRSQQEPERDGGGDAEWRTIGIVAFVKT